MALYHASLYLPPNLTLPNGMWSLEYSGHAKQAARNDRYGSLTLPTFIDTRKCTVIEVEVHNGRIQKIVYRMKMDDTRDISLAVIPMRSSWYVKTVWGNLFDDHHATLNAERYSKV